MKIGIVTHTFPNLSETFIQNQIIYLLKKGYKVEINAFEFSLSGSVHQQYQNNKLGQITHYIPKFPKSYFLRIKYLIHQIYHHFSLTRIVGILKCLNFFKLNRQALTLYLPCLYASLAHLEKFDIIHVHFGKTAELIAMFRHVGLFKKVKLIGSFHGFDLPPHQLSNYHKSYRHLFKYIDIITVNTAYTNSLLGKVQSFPKEKIHILPVGLDTGFFRKEVEKNDMYKMGFYILFCGRLVSWKGADTAIKIIHLLLKRGKQVELTIIGEGPEKSALVREVEELNLSKCIHFAGQMSQQEIKREMERADLFLFPGRVDKKTGRCENQGLVIQEAQAMELPIVTSNVGGIRDGLADQNKLNTVESDNIEMFADVIEKLMEDFQLRSDIGKSGREFVLARYDNNVLGDELVSIYQNSMQK